MKKLLLLSAIALITFSCEEPEPVFFPTNTTNNGGTTTTEDVQPIASFSCKKGEKPFNVVFTNTSKYAKYTEWDFGDGEASTSTNPTHQYSSAGIYTVTLTVHNGNRSDRITKSISISKPTTCYVTGIRYDRVAYTGYYYYTKLDDDGPWVVYNKFTTNYTLVDKNNISYTFNNPVELDNLKKHDYYTLYVYYSSNSSKKGTQVLCKKIYTDELYKYPLEVTKNNSDVKITVYFKWNW